MFWLAVHRKAKRYLGVRNVVDAWTLLHTSGHIDDDVYHHNIERSIRTFQPYWTAFGLTGGRPGLVAAIEAATKGGANQAKA